MPIRSSILRTIAAAWLASATLLAAPAGPAAALEPPRPLPGYHPRFVTETDTRPWKDCLWASGAMLLDKWTNGRDTVSRQALRRLSGDRHGGSTLADLRAAYAKLGINLAYSPDGGARITWPTLLRRLEQGAGAVLLGDDSKLPRWYGRWDLAFWKATDEGDNHAVYIERYDRKRGRVWLMDPLGWGNWAGEWISVAALSRYAWTTRAGVLSVAVTPTAKPAPFTGVAIGTPIATITSRTIEVGWGIRAPRGWSFPGADVTTQFAVAPDPVLLAATAPQPLVAPASGDLPAAPVAALIGKALRATAPLPIEPGAYATTATLQDRRFGGVVAESATLAVFVSGPRQAAIEPRIADANVVAGSALPVTVAVENIGSVTWAEDPLGFGTRTTVAATRDTRLIARWIPISVRGMGPEDGSAPASGPVATLGGVPLAPGGQSLVEGEVTVPVIAGVWALAFDIVDNVNGSFAALGSAPAVQVLVVRDQDDSIPVQVVPVAGG